MTGGDPTGAPHRLLVPALASAGILVSVQATVLVPFVSLLPEIYGVGVARASWLITSTLVVAALATPVVSRLADMYGKQRMVVVALGVVITGSLVLALTHNLALALLGRSMQGFGSALIPVAMSILKDTMPAERLGPSIALISATMGTGAALGLPVSGVLYSWLGWHSLFWLTAVLGVLVLAVLWSTLPANRPTSGRVRVPFDWLGAAALLLSLTPLLIVLSQGNRWGWDSTTVLGLAALSIVAGALFAWRESRGTDSLVDLHLATRRPVLMANVASLALAMGMLANLLLMSGQLGSPREAGGFGLPTGSVGLASAVPSAVLVLCSPVVGRLLRRLGGRVVLAMGGAVMAIGYIARLFLDGSVAHVVLGAALVGIGTSLSMSAPPMIIMNVVPPSQSASANGVNSLFRMIGTSMSTAGIAALTTATVVVVAGHEYASPRTFHLAFAIGAGITLAAGALALLIPREPR